MICGAEPAHRWCVRGAELLAAGGATADLLKELSISQGIFSGDMTKPKAEKVVELPVGELNPGLPRDRRGYSPLY